MVDSHKALSSASPTVPIEPANPGGEQFGGEGDRDVLRPGVGMMDQTSGHPVVFTAAADLQRLPEGVGDHAGVLGRGDPPAQDPAGEHVDNTT